MIEVSKGVKGNLTPKFVNRLFPRRMLLLKYIPEATVQKLYLSNMI